MMYPGHIDWITSVKWYNNEQFVSTGDNFIILWDLQNSEIDRKNINFDSLLDCCFASENEVCVCGNNENGNLELVKLC